MVESPDSATVLSTFYASVILLITRRISYDLASTLGESEPKVIHRPIVLLLEEENKVLYELFKAKNYTVSYFLAGNKAVSPGPCSWKIMLVANRVAMSHSDTMLVEAANADFFDRFESRTGFRAFKLTPHDASNTRTGEGHEPVNCPHSPNYILA